VGGTLSDSKGNTWVALPTHIAGGSGACHLTLYYAKNALVGAGHTFTFSNGVTTFPALSVSAWSGADTVSPFDVEYGMSAVSATLSTGTITPGSANELWVSGTCSSQASSFLAPNNGTAINSISYRSGLSFGVATSYKIQATIATEQEVWNYGTVIGSASTIASFKGSAFCNITTASLPDGTVSTAYSQTITTNCAAPTFSVSAGALPVGLSLNTATGLISGTPTTITGSPFSFTVAVADANGNPSQSYSMAIAVTPVITVGPTCTGNSPSSVKCTWTTDIPSSSQVQCGTVSGGPYTTYQTTEVYTAASGPGAGVTSHSMVIPGLPNNASPTAYYFRVLSRQPAGSFAASAEVSTGTLAAMVSTPMAVQLSPVTRYNDQYNGVRGMPNLGIAANGDTYYPTMWADDGNLYGFANDTSGLATGHGSYALYGTGRNLSVYKSTPASGTPAAVTASLLTMSLVNSLSNFGTEGMTNTCTNGTHTGSGCWTDGATWKSGNGISFNGKLVQHVMRQGSGQGLFGDSSLIVSSDHGATWLAPQNYPGGTPNANGDPPTAGTAMWTGYGTFNNCAEVAIPQHGQDYGFTNPANFVNYGNADAFVYMICTRGDGGRWYLARVRVEDFLLLDVTKYQYYTGGDGLLDVNWTNTAAGAFAIWVGTAGGGPGSCSESNVEFIPDFNRWMFTCWGGPAGSGVPATVMIMDAPYPWGPTFTLVAGLPRVQSNLNYAPSFIAPLASTYSKTSSNPLVSSIVIMTSGAYFGQFAGDPANDEYSPHWFTARLVPADPSRRGPPHRPYASRNGRNAHLVAGLDLFYNFQGGGGSSGTSLSEAKGSTFSYTIPDLSPNGKYSIALPVSTPAIFDQYGMINFGFWSGFSTACSPACALPVNYTLPTPYNAALNDFTMAVVFSHYPSSMAISSAELVLDTKDLQLLRNGSTPNSWGIATTGQVAVTDAGCAGNVVTLTTNTNTFTGGPIAISGMNPSGYNAIVTPTQVTSTSVSYTIGSCPGAFVGGGTVANAIGPFTLATDGSFAALLIRRIGSALTVYQSGGVGPSLPLTALAAGTLTGTLGANNLNIGATLHGILSELLIYNRGLADDELVREMAVIRREMGQRGISLP
jgi:hypothetical protein